MFSSATLTKPAFWLAVCLLATTGAFAKGPHEVGEPDRDFNAVEADAIIYNYVAGFAGVNKGHFEVRPKRFLTRVPCVDIGINIPGVCDTTVNGWQLWFIPETEIDPLIANGTALPGSPVNSAIPFDGALGTDLVIVGASESGNQGPYHAFKWVFDGTTGVISDLGTLRDLAADRSYAFGISFDGTTIVGSSQVNDDNDLHAFRIGSDDVMRDLGTLAGGTGFSNAFDVNGDGSVVVGDSFTSIGTPVHAFRWDQTGPTTGTMTDLGSLQFDSHAMGVNRDGTVIVGGSSLNVPGGSFEQHAVIWDAGGIYDIGVLAGHKAAMATAVSDNGEVVVGISDPLHVDRSNLGYSISDGDVLTRPFRWTDATGMEDLNGVVAAQGVDMSDIRLVSALDVSDDGRYISGLASFDPAKPLDLSHYILCYADAATEGGDCPEGGVTTPNSLQVSFDDVAQSANGFALRASGLAGTMFGWGSPAPAGNQVSAHGMLMPFSGGASLNYDLGNGLTVLAAASIVSDAFAGLSIDPAFAGGLAFRYDLPQSGLSFQPFAEAGAFGLPMFSAHISRSYDNGAGTAIGTGTTSGSFGGIYARGGIALEPTPNDRVELSAALVQGWLGLAAYSESGGAGNPFPATIKAQRQASTTVSVGAAWTRELTPNLSLTLNADVGHVFGAPTVTGSIPGAGTLSGTGSGISFLDGGAALGWRVSDQLGVDARLGATLAGGLGISVQAGAGLHLSL